MKDPTVKRMIKKVDIGWKMRRIVKKLIGAKYTPSKTTAKRMIKTLFKKS